MFIVSKRYKKPSVPRTKRVYDEDNNTIIDTGIPNLNGVREYTQPVHNAVDKSSVCKYCAKNLVRGYICRDCRELEKPVKSTSIEERLAIEEGLRLIAQSDANRKAIRKADAEREGWYTAGEPYDYWLDTAEYCKSCGLYIPETKETCDFGC